MGGRAARRGSGRATALNLSRKGRGGPLWTEPLRFDSSAMELSTPTAVEPEVRRLKILIVGAGIAGPTLAYWLRRGGHRATLIEYAPELMVALTFLDDSRELPESRAAQEALLRARFANAGWQTQAILAQMSKAESLYLDRVSQIRMPSWTRGRVGVGGRRRCLSVAPGRSGLCARDDRGVRAGYGARGCSKPC